MFQVKKKEKSNKPVQSLHSQTWPILDGVLSNMKGLVEEIDLMIGRNCKKEVEENRKRLAPIIDTVILLGRLGLAFRGHRDDSQFHPNIGEYSSGGVGNFVEVLNYRVRGGDLVENHLRTCSKNASYFSKTSQNELINCCGNYIKDILVKEIKENRFFSVLVDEASDCSNQEQLSLVIRFVDGSGEIREEFLGFLHCELGLSGKALSYYKLLTSFHFISALVITRHVLDLNLPVTKLLQGPAIDVADPSHLIESLKSLIISKRSNVD